MTLYSSIQHGFDIRIYCKVIIIVSQLPSSHTVTNFSYENFQNFHIYNAVLSTIGCILTIYPD